MKNREKRRAGSGGFGGRGAAKFVSHLTVNGLARLEKESLLDPLRFRGRLLFEKRVLERLRKEGTRAAA